MKSFIHPYDLALFVPADLLILSEFFPDSLSRITLIIRELELSFR